MQKDTVNLGRCFWVVPDPLLVAYHDDEWGVPCHDDRELFERLMLEVNQVGPWWKLLTNWPRPTVATQRV